jgi:dsRNA-specific ribonuclease
MYSFTEKEFPMNAIKLEPFESPKILGDIFESVMGAIFEDGGLDEIHRVYKHILSPLILYNSKFSKLSAVYGEPKE